MSDKGIFPLIALAIYVLFLLVKMTGNIIPISLYVIATVSLVLSSVYWFRQAKKFGLLNKALVGLCIFMGYGIVSLLWTDAPNYGIQKMFILLALVTISWFLSRLVIDHGLDFIKLFSLGSLFILFWYLSTQGFKKIDLESQYFRLALKDELNPIVISRYFCFSIITFFYYLRFASTSQLKWLIVWCIISLSFVLAFLTGSKGPLLSFILAIVAPYVIGKQISLSHLAKMVVAVTVGLGVVILLFGALSEGGGLSEFIARRYWGQGTDGSISSRLELFSLTVNHIVRQPFFAFLFGNGIGDFGFLVTGQDQAMYPHNIFLEILYELGAFGLLIFLFIVVRVVKFNYRISWALLSHKEVSTLNYFFSLFYFFFLGAFTSGDISGNFFVFVSIMLLLRVHTLYSLRIYERRRMLEGYHIS